MHQALKRLKRSPKVAFLNLAIFTLVSVLFFIQKSDVISRRKLLSKNGKEYGHELTLQKTLEYFFWPEQRARDKLNNRRSSWSDSLNSTRNQKHEKRFPDIVLAGAESCGTDGLGKLLQLHPLVKRVPEDTQYFTRHYSKGPLYYREKMPRVAEKELTLEVSPTYFSWPPIALPKRIKALMPKTKVIVLLCDPVDRVARDFNEETESRRLSRTSKYEIFLGTYLRKFGFDKFSRFSSALDLKVQSVMFDSFTEDYASHLITSGMYYYHAVRWKAEFDFKHLMFVSRDSMMKSPGDLMEKLQTFLQLPVLLFPEDFLFDQDARSHCFEPLDLYQLPNLDRKCPLQQEARKIVTQSKSCEQTLKKFYTPYNKKLYWILKNNFNW